MKNDSYYYYCHDINLKLKSKFINLMGSYLVLTTSTGEATRVAVNPAVTAAEK